MYICLPVCACTHKNAILQTGSLTGLDLTNSSSLPGCEPQGSTCFCLLSTGIANTSTSLFIFKIYFILCVCGFCLPACMYVCTTCMSRSCRGQKRVSDLQNRSGQWARAAVWVLGTEPESSARTASALNCGVFFLIAPFFLHTFWDKTQAFSLTRQVLCRLTYLFSLVLLF